MQQSLSPRDRQNLKSVVLASLYLEQILFHRFMRIVTFDQSRAPSRCQVELIPPHPLSILCVWVQDLHAKEPSPSCSPPQLSGPRTIVSFSCPARILTYWSLKFDFCVQIPWPLLPDSPTPLATPLSDWPWLLDSPGHEPPLSKVQGPWTETLWIDQDCRRSNYIKILQNG